MLKTFNTILKQTREAYRVPKTVQDLIPITRVFPDGIFLCGRIYTKCWMFTDINYMSANEQDKKTMLGEYMNYLKSLDSEGTSKITLNNRRINMDEFEEKVLMRLQGDEADVFRKEYNDMLLKCAEEANGIIQEKYITVSICKKDIEEARAWFADYEVKLSGKFSSLGSRTAALDLTDRLRILYNFYRCGEEEYFCFDPKDCIRKGHSFKDYICPDIVEKHQDCLKLGNRYARAIYLKDYANHISDELIRKLTDLNRTMMLSIDVISIPTDEAVRRVEQ